MSRPTTAFLLILNLLASAACAAPASQRSDDAWPLYSRAMQRVEQGYRANIMSPAASSLAYDGPPYPKEWHALEDASYTFNAPARALIREARSMNKANWPSAPVGGKEDFRYLNGCRAVANEVADAAVQEHLKGDDAAAVESIRDLLHMADLLDGAPAPSIIRPIVAVGVRMVAMDRLEIITGDLSLTNDPADSKKLQINSAKALIRQLFNVPDPEKQFGNVVQQETAAGKLDTTQKDRFYIQRHRGQMERKLASMSLACHLFRFDKHGWPASVEELTAYLPAPPRDAWGAMGYVVIKAGRPDGADRPLVYSRCNSADGLFYPVDEPQFSYYPGYPPGKPHNQGGQFRDVTSWAPRAPKAAPTTRPLP
jgi:hypothetical protein